MISSVSVQFALKMWSGNVVAWLAVLAVNLYPTDSYLRGGYGRGSDVVTTAPEAQPESSVNSGGYGWNAARDAARNAGSAVAERGRGVGNYVGSWFGRGNPPEGPPNNTLPAGGNPSGGNSGTYGRGIGSGVRGGSSIVERARAAGGYAAGGARGVGSYVSSLFNRSSGASGRGDNPEDVSREQPGWSYWGRPESTVNPYYLSASQRPGSGWDRGWRRPYGHPEVTAAPSGYHPVVFPGSETGRNVGGYGGARNYVGGLYGGLPGSNAPVCDPPCQNGGMCESDNVCKCIGPYHGTHCQYKKEQCSGRPPTPMNSRISCYPGKCTATCRDGHEFPDGTNTLVISCKLGEWVMEGKPWNSIPDCGPTCTPKCQNGGNCIGYNLCECPQDFRGPLCQYSKEECNIKKLGFNGAYKCEGDGTSFTCRINCPEGMHFMTPAAREYVCRYDKGVFLPGNPPPCVFDEGYEGSEVEILYSNRSRTIHEDGSTRRVSVTGPSSFATCYAWGGQHYKTLSDAILNFKSDCSYNLLSDEQDNFRILSPVLLSECDHSKLGCFQLHFFVHNELYKLSTDEFGSPIVLQDTKFPIYIPAKFPGFRIDIGSQSVTVTLSNAPVILSWDLEDGVEVKVGERLWDVTKGLCGQKDKNPVGANTLKQFASNARIDTINEICEEEINDETPCLNEASDMAAHQFCNRLMVDPRFATCRTVVDAQTFYEACKWEFCLCENGGGSNCGCDTLTLFVKEAIAKGVEISSWRDNSCCPMECTGGKVYKSCGRESVCGGAGSPGGTTSCEEGCFCPDGTFLSNNTCVHEDQCHCLLRGQRHPPGSKVPKECNTCTCAGGEWRCTKLDCPGRCEAVGDPHYTTFDRKSYDFMGKCSYYLLVMDNYSVEAENVPCDGSISQSMGFSAVVQRGMPSCTKSVTIKLGTTSVKLKQNQEITVNGDEVIPPVPLAHAYIRQATTEYIQVELEDGVEIWWDGKTSVFIHAPPSLKGKTKGLCGTFTGNQKDDFLTPEGDVEQDPISFANKWKTVDSCESHASDIQEHPCDANPQNKPTAEKLCAHLTSNLFMHCHSFVDPAKYHANCLYDMCACKGPVSDCLCPVLSAYAKECAYQGVEQPWRNKVRECGLACPRGQQYQICAESCLRSCDDISRESHCSSQCVDGCSCPEGSTLDRKGNCVPISTCPCTYKGLKYPPGHAEIRRSAQGFQLCTCANARWSCKLAAPEEINKFPNDTAEAKACPASKNLVYTHCESTTPITCQNMHHPGLHEVSESVCYGGCVCMKGYVLDSITNECVKPESCPCHHGGKSYVEGTKIQEECNSCSCKQGKWDCTHNVCPGLCTAWGDSHFKTFDDRMYDFQGSCQYMLSKGVISSDSNSLADSYSIVIEMVPCGTSGVSCSKSVTLSVGSGASQEVVIFSEGKATPSNENHHRILLREAGLFMFADVPDLGLVVQWDKGTRVTVRLDSRWKNRVRGLCGNFNDNSEDDFQTPSGGITEASVDYFCDSWKVHEYCPVAQPIQDICEQQPERKAWSISKCSVLKSSLFKLCHSEVPVGPYLEKCIYDTCACDEGGDCECLCTALAAYAQECNAHGVPITWRSQQLCPLQCDQRCSEYSACVPTCPVETCDSVFDTKSELCQTDVCVEGCKMKTCPDDMVYSNLTNPECVPRATCKPPCMTVNGKIYYEGDLMEEDNCHSCYCSRKQKSCTGKPCSTTVMPEEYEIITTTKTYGRSNIMKDAKSPCNHGWSEWFNRNHPIGKVNSDHEPIPEFFEFTTVDTSSSFLPMETGCSKDNITKVECRVAGTHEDLKHFGEDAECSIEKGLICVNGCHDYEMRVYCSCYEEPAIPTTLRPVFAKTTIHEEEASEEGRAELPPMFQNCDPAHPVKEHEHLCAAYYRCEETASGIKWVLNSCPAATYFNPQHMICDQLSVVRELRPHCTDLDQNENVPTKSPVLDHEGGCIMDEQWDDCSIDCMQLCHYYEHAMFNSGACHKGRRCTPGCRAKRRPQCPIGMWWRDAETCVDERDCVCVSKTGKMVKPGELIQESACEVCQCLHNKYVCDTNACKISTMPWVMHRPSTPYHTVEPLFDKTERPNVFVEFISTPPTVIELVHPTITPPPYCDDLNFVPLANQLPPEAFTASSFDLDAEPPRGSYGIPGIWRPASEKNQSLNEFLQIDLGRVNNIYGVIIKGIPEANDYVTKFYVLYSNDNHNYKYVTFMGIPELFSGPFNRFEESKQVFSTPVEARYVRISPREWNRNIAAKVDVIGCMKSIEEIIQLTTPLPPKPTIQPKCADHMSQGIVDDQITASTGRPTAAQISIDGDLGWIPASFAVGQWLQFDFQDKRELTGIILMGGGKGVYLVDNFPSWVQEFKVKFSPDGRSWNNIKNEDGQTMMFHGNDDNSKKLTVIFDQPIRARYLKIYPQKWHKKISMRAEVLGCYEPYQEIKIAKPTRGPPPRGLEECQLCPGAKYPETATCPCLPEQWWDGERCSPRQQCPCYIDYIKYTVGSAYENMMCEQCICTLNGVPQCSPKKCPPCEPGTVSLITNGCGCLCKPCGPDEILCPSTNVCVDRSVWCDGTVDCGDDEVNCTQPTTPFIPPVVRRITTVPTPVEEKPTECPLIECPPGFTASISESTKELVVEESKPKGWSPFGSNSRWRSLMGRASERTSSATGYKTAKTRKGSYDYKKHAYAHNEPIESKTTQPKGGSPLKLTDQCPQYKCIPVKGSPLVEECPPKPRCQQGFDLQVAKSPEEKCSIYSCIQKEVKPPDGKCNVTGRTFTTFDGTDYKYDICDHVLARDKINNLWEVKIMKECSYIGPCFKYLVIKQDDNILKFKPNLSAEYNGYNYSIPQIQKIGGQTEEFALKQVSDTYLLFSSIHEFSIVWDTLGNVKIIVPGSSVGKVDGMCGFFDGHAENDKMKPDGTPAHTSVEFGDSWGIPEKCTAHVCPVEIQKEAFKACNAIREEPLNECGSWVPLENLVSKCVETLCSCIESGSTLKDCRCNVLLQAVTECRSFAPTIELNDWRLINDCPVECPDGLVYHECFRRSCEPCCSELMVEDACPLTDQCFPGCYCPAGYVREGERCVKPSDCRDCMCEGYDKSRFVPFDKKDYRFAGNCTYVLSQTLTDVKGPSFKIYGTNGLCEDGSGEICIQSITIMVKDHIVHVSYRNDKLKLKIDGVEQTQLARKSDWLNVHELAGKSILVCLVQMEVDLEFFIKGKGFSLKVPSHYYNSKTEGLCGNCNLNSTDDFKSSDGLILVEDVDTFGSSWKIQESPEFFASLGIEDEMCGVKEKEPECVLPPPHEDPCLKLMDASVFGRCHAVIDPKIHVENCHLALCKEEISICQFMESYVRECSEEAICLDWRTPERCPYFCPKGLEYRYCTLGCKLNCDNYKIFQEDLSACKSPMKEGCVCPDGQVTKEGACINATRCEPCDAEGHYPGDEWHPDPCTKCTCEATKPGLSQSGPQVQCQTTHCPPANLCTRGFKTTLIKASENACCPEYVCVPEPTSGPVCEEPQQPVCGFGQVMQLETGANGCQQFTCRCKALEDCDSTAEEMSKKREPGMVAELDTSGCCARVVVSCKKDTCPLPPKCPPHHEPVPKETGSCCKEYTCEIPEGKCLYEMLYEEEPSGGEKERSPAERTSVLKDFGDMWNDGPCRTCECKEGSSKASCSKKVCGLPPKSDSYVYEPKYQKHQCCPIYMRTACKVNGKVHQINETWPDPEGDPCKSYMCVSGRAGEVSIKEETQTCNKKCKIGWEYEKSSPYDCCGQCVQVGCVIDGKVFAEGANWTSADLCTEFACELFDEQFQIVSQQVLCENITGCPEDQVYKEGCCHKCKVPVYPFTRNLMNCAAESLAKNETVKLIKEATEEHGECYNLEPIQGFSECRGTCDSYTKFNQVTGEQDSACHCCEAIQFSPISIRMDCSDGFFFNKIIKVPSDCHCNLKNCDLNPPQLIKKPYAGYK